MSVTEVEPSIQDIQQAIFRIRQQQRARTGCCRRCGAPSPEHPTCSLCLELKRLKRALRIANGMCGQCANRAVPGQTLCERHRQLNLERVRRSAAKAKAATP